jgi:hypothetical protein
VSREAPAGFCERRGVRLPPATHPLISHEVIINLITGTTTGPGLRVYAQLDERPYPKGVRVLDEQLAAVNIERDPFHGEWNYTIKPSLIKS